MPMSEAAVWIGSGAALGLVAQATADPTTSQAILPAILGGGGGLLGWVSYLVAWVVPSKDRQIKDLVEVNGKWAETLQKRMEARDAQLNAVIDAKDREREVAIKDVYAKSDDVVRTMTTAFGEETKRRDARQDQKTAELRADYERRIAELVAQLADMQKRVDACQDRERSLLTDLRATHNKRPSPEGERK